MISVSLEFDPSDIMGIADAIDEGASQAMSLSVDAIAAEAKTKTPHKTGQLTASIQPGEVGGTLSSGTLHGNVLALAPYAAFVNEGTRAHPIFPVKRKALRFPGNQGYAFSKRVMHPGTKAQPFLKPEQYADKVATIFSDAITLALDT